MVYIDVGQKPRLRGDLEVMGYSLIKIVPAVGIQNGVVIERSDQDILSELIIGLSQFSRGTRYESKFIYNIDTIFEERSSPEFPEYHVVPVIDGKGNIRPDLKAVVARLKPPLKNKYPKRNDLMEIYNKIDEASLYNKYNRVDG